MISSRRKRNNCLPCKGLGDYFFLFAAMASTNVTKLMITNTKKPQLLLWLFSVSNDVNVDNITNTKKPQQKLWHFSVSNH